VCIDLLEHVESLSFDVARTGINVEGTLLNQQQRLMKKMMKLREQDPNYRAFPVSPLASACNC
jgi:hypothetical protein